MFIYNWFRSVASAFVRSEVDVSFSGITPETREQKALLRFPGFADVELSATQFDKMREIDGGKFAADLLFAKLEFAGWRAVKWRPPVSLKQPRITMTLACGCIECTLFDGSVNVAHCVSHKVPE